MHSDTSSLRAKLAKLLRLQQSPNPNEAANAAAKVEQLCREHGLTVESIDCDFDPDKDEALMATINTGKRTIVHADVQLMAHVVRYFNGEIVTGYKDSYRVWNIFATKGNHAQIGLYFDYLLDCRERAVREAHCPSWESKRSFNSGFRLGFAHSVGQRLRDLKARKDAETAATGKLSTAPGLVPMPRHQMESSLAVALSEATFPKVGKLKSSSTRSASGIASGREAGNKVSLHKQATGGSTKALGAGR